MSAAGLPAFLVPGALVEWDTWCGPTGPYRVEIVDRFHVSLSRVGAGWWTPRHGIDATQFRTLAEACAHLRPVVTP